MAASKKAAAADEKEKDSVSTADGQKFIVLNSRQAQAQALAAEIAENQKSGVKIDETEPGGKYIGSDGEPHDAEGKPLKKSKKLDDEK